MKTPLLAACALVSCTFAHPADAQTPPAVAAAPPLVLLGTIDSEGSVHRLSFGRAGRVARIGINVGDRVRAGQVVATVDCSDVKSELAALEADWDLQKVTFQRRARVTGVAVARERLALAEADLGVAEAMRTKLESASHGTNFFSPHELEVATRRAIAARLDVATAKETLDRVENPLLQEDEAEIAARERIYRANAARLHYQASLCEIASPVAGVVTAVRKGAGEIAAAFDPVLSIADDGQRMVSVCVPEPAMGRLQVGERLRIRLPGVQDKFFSAAVARLKLPAMQADASGFAASCALQVWLEPAEKLLDAPLHSVAYVYVR